MQTSGEQSFGQFKVQTSETVTGTVCTVRESATEGERLIVESELDIILLVG